MPCESPTTFLIRRHNNLNAISVQNPYGRKIDFWSENLLSTSRKQSDTAPTCTFCGIMNHKFLRRRDRRRNHLKHGPYRPRKQSFHPLSVFPQLHGESKSTWVRQGLQHHLTSESLEPTPRALTVGVVAKRTDQLAITNTRRTIGFTGKASETSIHRGNRFLNSQIPLKHLFHQKNSTTGRVLLLTQLLIGRAAWQAKAAVNAFLNRIRHCLAHRTKLFFSNIVPHRLQSPNLDSGSKVRLMCDPSFSPRMTPMTGKSFEPESVFIPRTTTADKSSDWRR